MTSGELLKKLLKSYKQFDDESFRAVAFQIISEEKQKKHNVLARDLQRILENGDNMVKSVSSAHFLEFQKLPYDKEKGTHLFELRTSEKYLNDIVLGDEIKKQVYEIIQEFQSGELLRTFGLSPKRRLLFSGPPGCGKTLCAEVLAGELGLPLLYARFDAVISSYLGETSSNLRKIFDFANSGTWVILFDEFDAIGKSRDDLSEHGELKRVVNSFLQLLDAFQSESLIIAATNHESMLDRALWRRFDDILNFPLPNEHQILELIELKLKGFRHRNVDYSEFIHQMSGWSYADIERLCIDGIKMCILDRQDELTSHHFKLAFEKSKKRMQIIKNLQK